MFLIRYTTAGSTYFYDQSLNIDTSKQSLHKIMPFQLHINTEQMFIIICKHAQSHFCSKRFTTAAGLGGIWILEIKSSSNQCIAVVQLHTENKKQTLWITNCMVEHRSRISTPPSTEDEKRNILCDMSQLIKHDRDS